MNLRPVLLSWSQREKELDSERMITPKALGNSLEILLYATEKKNSSTSKIYQINFTRPYLCLFKHNPKKTQ